MAVTSDIQFDLVATSPLKRMMFASHGNGVESGGERVPDRGETVPDNGANSGTNNANNNGSNAKANNESHVSGGRKRSNSQSRVVAIPTGIGSHTHGHGQPQAHMSNIEENVGEEGGLGRRGSIEMAAGIGNHLSGGGGVSNGTVAGEVDVSGVETNSGSGSGSVSNTNSGGGHISGLSTGMNITTHRGAKLSNGGATTSSSSGTGSLSSSKTKASSKTSSSASSNSNSTSAAGRNHIGGHQSPKEGKRSACEYMVTLILLNDTFVKKQLHVPYYPETMKLGRPIGAKIKPDVNNGYFDSRVLSRNHADIYIDPKTGDLMLKDLNSSNGTFVNDVKLGADPVVLHIGDTVHLGFNIQAESNHKQISVRVENINIITNYMGNNMMWNDKRSKHVEYVKNIYNQLCTMEKEEDVYDVSLAESPSSKQVVTFDNALFGDINPKFEDNLLGLFSKNGAGFFNNSQIINNTAMENVLNILTLSLSEVRQQNNTLKSLEDYVRRYLAQADALAQRHINDVTKRKFHEMDTSFNKERQHHRSVKLDFKHYKEESEHKIGLLEHENYELASEIGDLKETVRMLQQVIEVSNKSKTPVPEEEEEQEEINASVSADPVDRLEDLAAQLSEVAKPKEVDDDDIEVHQLERLLNSSETLEDRDDPLAKEMDQVRILSVTSSNPMPKSIPPASNETPPPTASATNNRTHTAVLGISAVLLGVLIHRISH